MMIFWTSCKEKPIETHHIEQTTGQKQKKDTIISKNATPQARKSNTQIKSGWQEITAADNIVLDIRYASDNNFTEKKIYPCGKCFLRKDVAQRILKVNTELQERYNFKLKLFDCYRPKPAQQRLWDIVPDPDYVTPPQKGSMHNRGLAVDLTIVDATGDELDMGTPFDFFGEEAHHDYKDITPEVLKNRTLLKKIMETNDLMSIRTEWWHYSFTKGKSELSDWEWSCDEEL